MEKKPVNYTVMISFVLMNTSGYILTKFADLQVVTTKDGVETYFRHPVFQANSSFVVEFIVMVLLVWPFINIFLK